MKHERLLKEIYKTHEGASKRARFENGVAPSEYEKGYRARLYQYTAVLQDYKTWRVSVRQ